MQMTTLGPTDIQVSRLCLGTMTFGWSSDEATSHAILDAALDAGINFIDTADIYSRWIDGNSGGESETIIGRWLKSRPRDQVIVATKARGRMWDGPDGEGLSRAHIERACEDSLRRLQTDVIDLYQTHYPDDDVPEEETLRALDALVQAGKVRAIGCSNYSAAQLSAALRTSSAHGLARYVCLQPHYSLLHRAEFEQALAGLCVDQQVAVIPYSPLAAGFLTGKYTRAARDVDTTRSTSGLIQRLTGDERAYVVVDAVRDAADRLAVPMAQVALAWLLAQPGVTAPIIGARTLDQLHESIDATALALPEDVLMQLSTLSTGF